MNKRLPATFIVHDKSQLPPTSVRKDGMLHVHTPTITCVAISDITQVKEHRICEIMGTVSHAVKFRNGGHLYYSYGIDGGPIEVQGEGVDIHHVGNGILMAMPTLDLLAPDKEGWQPF